MTHLSCDFTDDAWQRVIFRLPLFRPRCKVPQLPLHGLASRHASSHDLRSTCVVAIIRQPHLGSDEENLAIVDDDSTIVRNILVRNRPTHQLGRGRQRGDGVTHIPMSQTISCSSSSCNTFASTSHECNIVSPAIQSIDRVTCRA